MNCVYLHVRYVRRLQIFAVVSAQKALEMLSKAYGVPEMKAVFQHRFPVNDMVCRDELAVYYSDDMTSYFKPGGTSIKTILHEFYDRLVNSYGVRDMLDIKFYPIQSLVILQEMKERNVQPTVM